jgi:hypothetical protein
VIERRPIRPVGDERVAHGSWSSHLCSLSSGPSSFALTLRKAPLELKSIRQASRTACSVHGNLVKTRSTQPVASS